MTTTRVYKSTDSGAPVLTGGVSALINVLDKCLVAGYGSKTAAGWTKPYTGTNKAAFRNSTAAGGTGMYVRVLDDGSATGGARNALCRAYATMSNVDTGTIQTPTSAQLAASIVWRKSDTTDSTARDWILVADELTFYLCVDTGTVASNGGCGTYAAGDFQSFVAGDAYRFFVAGRETAHAASAQGDAGGLMSLAGWESTTTVGFWMARGYAGSGSPIRAGIPVFGGMNAAVPVGAGNGTLTNPALGSSLNFFTPAHIVAESTLRGRLRGIYMPLNDHTGVALGTDVVNPPGLTATLTALRHCSATVDSNFNTDGHLYVDTTSGWAL